MSPPAGRPGVRRQASSRARASSRSRTRGPPARTPSCSNSSVTQVRSPRIARAVSQGVAPCRRTCRRGRRPRRPGPRWRRGGPGRTGAASRCGRRGVRRSRAAGAGPGRTSNIQGWTDSPVNSSGPSPARALAASNCGNSARTRSADQAVGRLVLAVDGLVDEGVQRVAGVRQEALGLLLERVGEGRALRGADEGVLQQVVQPVAALAAAEEDAEGLEGLDGQPVAVRQDRRRA